MDEGNLSQLKQDALEKVIFHMPPKAGLTQYRTHEEAVRHRVRIGVGFSDLELPSTNSSDPKVAGEMTKTRRDSGSGGFHRVCQPVGSLMRQKTASSAATGEGGSSQWDVGLWRTMPE